MGLPFFVAPKDGQRSWTAVDGERSSSNSRMPVLSDGTGIAHRAAWQDMDTWSSTASSLPPRPAPGSVVHGSPPESVETELLLLDIYDVEDSDDGDYVDSDFEDDARTVTDNGFRIKIDLYGNYTITRDFPDPDGAHLEAEEELRQILLAGLEKIRRDNEAAPTRRHPESAYDLRSLFASGEVPLLPTLLAERYREGGEPRLSSTMASNVQGLTENLADATREYTVMLEQMLDRTRGELAVKNQELAEAKEKLEAREEQIRRIEAIFEGAYYGH